MCPGHPFDVPCLSIASIPLDNAPVELDSQPGGGRKIHDSIVHDRLGLDELAAQQAVIDMRRYELEHRRGWTSCLKMQAALHGYARFPSVRDDLHAVQLAHVRDAAYLGKPATTTDIR